MCLVLFGQAQYYVSKARKLDELEKSMIEKKEQEREAMRRKLEEEEVS